MGLRSSPFISRKALREALQRPSSWVLIAVNLGLIAGVIAWDWSVFDIIFLYWVENLVIGAINVLKMASANPGHESLTFLVDAMKARSTPEQAKQMEEKISNSPMTRMGGVIKLFLIPFFIIHYGMFCYGHGIFIFSMFRDSSSGDIANGWDLLSGNMLFAVSLLAASHLFSFFRNFIAAGEYKHTHPATLMMRPYGRIIALHITIIFGGFLTMAFGSPMGLLVVLMLLKTSVDLAMHQSERVKFQGIY